MSVDGSIKINITADSASARKELQRLEQRAAQAARSAREALSKTESTISTVEARIAEIAARKRAELNIGVKWDPRALDEAVDRALAVDKEYKSLERRLQSLSIKQEVQKATTERASEAHERAARAVLDEAAARERAGRATSDHTREQRDSRTTSEKVKDAFTRISASLRSMAQNSRKAGNETRKTSQKMRQAKQNVDPLTKSISRLASMFKLMIIRMVMRNIINSVKEGLADLAAYSSEFESTLSRFTTAFLYVRNALTSALKPILEAIAPLIEGIADSFAKAADKAAQFATAVFGNSDMYTQAQKAAKKYGDETKNTAKKVDKAFASFDKINQLNFGKQEEAQGPSPDEMFQEAPIDEKIVGLADRVRDLFAELMEYAAQIKDVFAQSWKLGGQDSIDAAKAALKSLLELVKTIGSTFGKIWTNGTGLALLNNIQLLLQTIFGIVEALASAFVAAWNTNELGSRLIQAILDALHNVITLVIAIGQSFIDAWNSGGLGHSIMGHILSIITGIVNIVKELAARLTEAWNANENGKAIWSAILGILNTILATIDNMIQATVTWAQGLNLEPLVSSVRGMLEALQPVIEIIGRCVKHIWDQVVLPFFSWVLEKGLPNVIQKLTDLFNFLSTHSGVVKTITELVIAFIVAWKLAGAIGQVIELFSNLDGVKIILTILIGLIIAMLGAWDNMNSVQKAISVIGVLFIAVAALAVAMGSLQGVGGVAAIATALVVGIGFVVGSINSINGKMKGMQSKSGMRSGYSSGAMPAAYDLRSAPIPRLATGAVIPPNNEFLAVLGDQKHGTNIEAPLSTIKEAVKQASSEQGGAGGAKEITLRIVFDDSKFARAMKVKLDEQSRLGGVKLTSGGAY